MTVAEERRGLSEERLAASRAAEEARGAQLQLTDAVRSYVQQGIPIPFVVEGELTGACSRGEKRGGALLAAAGRACNRGAGGIAHCRARHQ